EPPRLSSAASWLSEIQSRDQVAIDVLPRYRNRGGQSEIVLLEYPVGTVAGAYQRPGSDFHEALGQTQFTVTIELLGADPALDGQVIAGGLQVLAEGDDIHANGPQFIEGLQDFLIGFTQANHQAGLGQHLRAMALGVLQHLQGL